MTAGTESGRTESSMTLNEISADSGNWIWKKSALISAFVFASESVRKREIVVVKAERAREHTARWYSVW